MGSSVRPPPPPTRAGASASARAALLPWLGLVLLTGVVGAGAWWLSRPAAAVVLVESVPPGARLSLDGRVIGVTPARATDLVAGETYRMEVVLPGYEPWSETVLARPGLVRQAALLAPLRATLTVSSSPPGAHVWVDQVLFGAAPTDVAGIPVGRTVQVRASLAGHGEARRSVTITADDLRPRVTLVLPR